MGNHFDENIVEALGLLSERNKALVCELIILLGATDSEDIASPDEMTAYGKALKEFKRGEGAPLSATGLT